MNAQELKALTAVSYL